MIDSTYITPEHPLGDMLRSAVGMTHVLWSGLVIRELQSPLYSDIDHLHLSIEAQCVSHLLPLGDCHMTGACRMGLVPFIATLLGGYTTPFFPYRLIVCTEVLCN